MKRIFILLVCLLLPGMALAQASVNCGGKTSCIGWFFTTPSGTVSQTSPEFDVVDPGATDTRYDRFVAWVCDAYALTDNNGTPADPSDDFPVGCLTIGTKARHVTAWMLGQWRGTRDNVLRWEEDQRKAAVADGPDLPAE